MVLAYLGTLSAELRVRVLASCAREFADLNLAIE